MKKVLTFDRRPEVVSSGSSTDNGRSSAGDGEPGYLIQNRDLGKIHKAASGGDQAKVKDILLPQIHDVDDRDKMNRFTLKEEKEKRQKADQLYAKYKEQLIKKEEQYIKETEINRELETTLRTLEMELQIVRKNLSQVVGERNDILRQLSQEQNARKLQDENLAKLLCKQKEIERTYKEVNSENDDLTAKLKTASSKCTCLDGKNKLLQQELLSMKAIEKKCEKLENKKQKLKQEIVNLKRHTEMNMVELSEVLLYKQKIEERAKQDVEDKLEEANQILQTQIASKEFSEQLIEYRNASVRRHLELRNKDLESQLSKVRISLNDSRSELEKYERLYLEELKGRKLLENELIETQERLTEVRTELLLQKGENRFLHSTLNMRPVLETPCAGQLSSFVPNRYSAPRETSRPCTSTYVIKVSCIIIFSPGFQISDIILVFNLVKF
ncbi:Ankyrin repeat domain-containing protein 26 [Myotis brandtii]|uniref:Ankyrin repeat domain-containing protein 26 n=1 Tax=Myotis brandtii TaxID=109478 RepID=S7N3F6_MYOBR|nr:Ankyrin repeat domain-containing protein 26 [Myotis brandtii]